MSYLVRFFRTARGEFPVRDFMLQQNNETRVKFYRLYDLLNEYGPRLTFPYSKHITGKIYELRIRGKTEVRIFYASVENSYILLHAIYKKSQKIPVREIKTAQERLTKI